MQRRDQVKGSWAECTEVSACGVWEAGDNPSMRAIQGDERFRVQWGAELSLGYEV